MYNKNKNGPKYTSLGDSWLDAVWVLALSEHKTYRLNKLRRYSWLEKCIQILVGIWTYKLEPKKGLHNFMNRPNPQQMYL